MPEPLTDKREGTPRSEEFSRLLHEIAGLLETPAAPSIFFAEFLQRVVSTVPVAGGAIWTRSPEGSFDLEHALHWPVLGLEAAPDGIACHNQILQVACQRERALWVPPEALAKS